MNYLYKFSCKPNYPVISEAFVIFHSSLHPNHFMEARLQGEKLAQSMGITFTQDNQACIYLGEFETIKSFKDLPILAVVTGEY